MKESSTEPPQKKLKQARLPFQILSPPVLKNVDSPPSQTKRKASEVASSEDDVVVSGINENKIKPVGKKPKVTNEEDRDNKHNGDESMEIEETKDKSSDVSKSTKKTKTPSNSSKRGSKTTPNRKSTSKNSCKVPAGKNEKSEIKEASSKPEVIDYVDLCESPVKKSKKNEEKELSVSETEPNKSTKDEENKSLASCSLLEKDASNSNHKSSKEVPDPLEKVVCDESSESGEKVAKHPESLEKKTPDLESSTNDKKSQKDSDKTKDETNESKSHSSDKKSTVEKSTLKQPSIKDKVASISPKMDSEPNCNNDTCKNINEKSITPSGESLKKDISDDCSTPKCTSEIAKKDESNQKTPSRRNDSPTVDDSSPSSECNTSTMSTPGSDSTKNLSKTPRRMTPKQLLKQKEKEEKRKERERLKEEKEKKKLEEKEEKLKLKKEKEDERLRLKQEKEEEKRKEREEKERKKQAEIDKKNEEKRLKEEERRLKEEEKQAKEEEKRKKEEEERKKKEEKRLKEEQKEAEKRKSAQAFASFFVKTESKSVAVEENKENTPAESNFQPFEVKNDMRLAPLQRRQLPEEGRKFLDNVVEGGTDSRAGQRLYLEQIRSPGYVRGSAPRTWPPPDEVDDEVIIIESEKPNELMEIDENEAEKKPEKRHHRAKLLQFHENRRPPYWGTWRKKSKHIRPRAPLNQDKTMLEYEVDSDDEWEEPEDGESLRGSDDEESQDEQYEEDNDMFVPHGYLSDGEGEDELDDQSPEAMKARLKLLQMEFEAERNEKQLKLKPRLIGCFWFCNSESSPANVGSPIAELFLQRRAVWEGSIPITVAASLPPSPSGGVTPADTSRDESRSGKKRLVKDSLVPDIIKKIHGSRKKLTKLLQELLDEWGKECPEALPSKNCLAKKIRELAVWEKPSEASHPCWFVKEELRKSYGLAELDLPPPPSPAHSFPSPAANITKFTKVLTTDERLKLLRESPSASKEAPKNTLAVPSSPAQNTVTPIKSVKTPTVKLGTSTPSPAVKKRVSLITIGPKESPKPSNSTSMMNFITKSAKSEENNASQKKEPAKPDGKTKKRITPITLTSVVSKPPQSSEDDCIVLD